MTSKQRAYLKSLAMKIEPILQIGKATVTPELTKSVDEALEARELIKIHVLKNCFADLKEIASVLAERTQSEVVQVIGRRIVLYRESSTKKKNKIELPSAKKTAQKTD
jgi:RNA-binding protein